MFGSKNASARIAEIPRSLLNLHTQVRPLIRERLWLQVLIGLALGVATGILIGPESGYLEAETSAKLAGWLALPGNLFLATIQFVVVPLVAVSVVRGIAAGEDLDTVRRIGLRVVVFFLVTTAIAVIIGAAVAYVVNPGAYVDSAAIQASMGTASQAVPNVSAPGPINIPEAIVGLIPQNPFSTLTEGDMLQIVIAAAIIGVALVMVPTEQSRPLLDLMGGVQAACMVIVKWVMRIAPFAVFGLITQIIARIGLDAILGMTVYVVTVIGGLLLMLGVYLAILPIFARVNPMVFLGKIREVMLLAFSTSSSAAVMPLSLRTAEENLAVRPAVSRLVVPLGTTINMSGTALYQAVAAIFLAQVFGIEIGVGGIMLILVTSIGASIGSPGTPGVGIVILATILASVGVPVAGIALILGVDRILDMCRTVLNVTGDLVACSVMDRLLPSDLGVPAGEKAQEPAIS